jgi:hypothetical protein
MENLLRPATRRMVVILGIAMLTALPVSAQQNIWRVDAEHSTAKIFMGTNSDLQNVGVALVGGKAEYDSADPSASALTILADLPDGAWMTFKSKRSELQADGSLHVTGEMTLVRAQYDAIYNPGEDYYGPISGKATVRKVTREVAFVLPPMNNPGPEMEVSAEALLGIENFPELFTEVRQAAWKPIVHDAACETPQAGEDYRGAECSGKLIAPTYQLVTINPGEDYRGDESDAPAGNGMKLVLHLQLSRQNLG